MNAKESILADIESAKQALAIAKAALEEYEAKAENNVYASLSDAEVLEDVLLDRAHQDCEGSYNCGRDEYRQEFIVGGSRYVAILRVEYNRHDKTYYYVDGAEFEIKPL